MKRVLVPLAEGFEELEAVTIIDILRRAGLEVVVASLARSPVTGAHGIQVAADAPLAALDFALALVEELEGRAARQAIESRLEREKPAAA